MSAAPSQTAKSRIEGYGTLLPAKWREIYEHVDDTESEEIPTNRMPGSVGDQILGETLRIARLRIKELEAETNLQQTELNRLKEYVNASETAGRTLYGEQVDDLKQTVAQHQAQMDYMRHAMKTKDAEIDVLKKKWQEYQEVQERMSNYEKDRMGEKDLLRKRAEQIDALQHKVNSYEQHMSDAQAASFQALQDQLHSFQSEMAAAAHLRTQLVDRDRQIDTIRQMYNDEVGHASSLTQQLQQATAGTAAAEQETKRAREEVEAAKAEAREANMASMRLNDTLQQAKIENKDLIMDNLRTREAAAHDKAAAADAEMREEELQASTAKLQKQLDKAVAERNSAEGRAQRSAAAQMKVKADLAQLEIKLQAKSDEVSHVNATWEQHENSMIDAQIKMTDMQAVTSAARKAEAEALAAKAAAEATLAAQVDMLERLRSRMAGAEAEMDGLRSQIAAVTAARDGLADELTVSHERVRLGQEALQEAQASLEGSQRELEALNEKHRRLMQQHERSEAELGDLHGVLLAKKADAEALESRLAAANEAGQQERLAAAELEVQMVGFKDRIRVAEHELAKQAPLLAQLNHSNQNMGNRITALEQLRNEMQEELLQQSVENSKLQHANEALAKQLSKTDDKSTSLQATVASLTEDNLKVQRESEVYERTLQKMNQQLQASLTSMAWEKNALLLSLTALQDQFEGMANAVYTAEETVVDDEVEKMRHAMAETASLLASAAYQQPQADLQIYKERLADHLADPSQPLNLDIDAQSIAEQRGGHQGGQQEGVDQQRGQLRTPPKTPGQDPAGRAARAKRAASSREVAAQVKQLEMKLISLRQELAERERQARQAEFTVRDLKLELDNLQRQNTADQEVRSHEVETLERKLTEAEREATAANNKAADLHAQLHGSTFHMKLAKEAMKKVRQAEEAAAAKAVEPPAPVRAPTPPVVDTEDKSVQTDARPLSPARKPDLFRKVTRQQPTPRAAPKAPTAPPPPVAPKKPDPQKPTPAPRPRLDQPRYPVPTRVQPAELRDQLAARVAPSVQLAEPVGEDFAQSLPHAADGLPAMHRPTLAPKKQPRTFLDDIKIPTGLVKRRGAAAASAAAPESDISGALDVPETDAALPQLADSVEQPLASQLQQQQQQVTPTAPRRVLRKADPNSSDATAGYQNPGLPATQLAPTVQGSVGGKAASAHPARAAVEAGKAGAASKRPSSHAAAAGHTGSPAAGLGSPAALGLSGHAARGLTKAPGAQRAAAMHVATASPAAADDAADSDVLTSDGETLLQPGVVLQHVAEPSGTGTDVVTDTQMLDAADGENAAAAQGNAFAQREAFSPDVSADYGGRPPDADLGAQLDSEYMSQGEEEGALLAESELLEGEPQQNSGSVTLTAAARQQVQRTVQRRIRHHRAVPQQPSELQPQISAVHGHAPEADSLPAATVTATQQRPKSGNAISSTLAKRAQHGSSKQKVPSLNLEIMRHLRQQISGLVPLDGGGSAKLSESTSARSPLASQGSLRTAQTDMTAAAASTARSTAQTRLLSIYPFRDLTCPKTEDTASVSTEAPMAPTWPSKVALSLDATVQLITDIYDSKSVADIAALRQQAQCRPMRAFAQQYLQRRFGTAPGAGWQQAWQQLQAAVLSHASDDRVASFGVTCSLLSTPEDARAAASVGLSSSEIMYNGSQPQQQLQTSTAWAAAWLTSLNSDQPPSAMPALQRLSVQSIAAVRSAALHPAVAEVLSGLALVPGMRFVLQCISSAAYARIVAGADLGIPLGQQQAPQIQSVLTAAASALCLHQTPALYLQHSDRPTIHYLELPGQTQLPGLSARLRHGFTSQSHAATAADGMHSSSAAAAIGQPVLVVSSRLIEVLQPDELQMMFLTTLATAHAPEACTQPPVDGRQVLAAGLRQVALAASLAALAPGPLLEQLADELGMLWPTRIQPALLRAQQYLPLWTDRCALQVLPKPGVLTSAVLKAAVGSPVLAGSLSPDAFMQEADTLQQAAQGKLASLEKRETGQTYAAINNSVTVLRIREVQRAQ